jgi:POT family proton-dependent oligopeptide transporter
MTESKYRTTPYDIKTMPPGIPYIIGNEAAERFSFYGMKAILTVFMTKFLVDAMGQPDHMSPEQAKATMGWFVAAVYATPFLGAILSDTILGKYRTIISLSLFYCVGHAVLAGMEVNWGPNIQPRWILFAGLAFIAFGAGGIKPCVSAHVGDQFGRHNQELLPRIFGWFYFSINFGSTFSTLLTPVLLDWYGPGWAFGIPGILMGLATLVFWMGRNKFVHIPPAGSKFFTETIGPDGLRALINLIPLLVFVAPFWSLFDQTASAWVIQAEMMNRTFIDIHLGSTHVVIAPSPAQLQAVNPILVMLFIPLFAYVIYPFVGRFLTITPLRKLGVGFFLAALSFVIPALLEAKISSGETPHAIWQIFAYVILTASEILVSITTLEFFYTQAPRRMKSFLMAFQLLAVSLGNVFTAIVNSVIERPDGSLLLEGASYYWFFVGVMFVSTLLFILWSQFYRGQTYIQGELETLPA